MTTEAEKPPGPGRGGRRENSGRKPFGDKAMPKIRITLSPLDIERAQALGGGNVSAGVRLALEIAAKQAEPK
jgi:hypothetical protein